MRKVVVAHMNVYTTSYDNLSLCHANSVIRLSGALLLALIILNPSMESNNHMPSKVWD